jgi:hypothetical protein
MYLIKCINLLIYYLKTSRESDDWDSATKTDRRTEICFWFMFIQCHLVSQHSVIRVHLTPHFVTHILVRSEHLDLRHFNLCIIAKCSKTPRSCSVACRQRVWTQIPWLWRPSVQDWYLFKQWETLLWRLCECVKNPVTSRSIAWKMKSDHFCTLGSLYLEAREFPQNSSWGDSTAHAYWFLCDVFHASRYTELVVHTIFKPTECTLLIYYTT